MQRKTFDKRENVKDLHAQMGFHYEKDYWEEGVAYEFTSQEVDNIEAATQELHDICMETVQELVKTGDYPEEFRLNNVAKEAIQTSWGDEHLYGRFDLCVKPDGTIKMFEYNADTPTSLLEAAVAQWQWLEDMQLPDQFNSIHEKLIYRFGELRKFGHPTLYLFASRDGHYEDWGNVEYIGDTAMQAGWNVHIDDIENIGYNSETGQFVDMNDRIIEYAFKLHAWEWLVEEEFGKFIPKADTVWVEPAWKMLLSNKAILPLLWNRYPNHPNLLESSYEPVENFVKKPQLGREGANVSIPDAHGVRDFIEAYDTHYIYQEYCKLPNFDSKFPVIGSWVIGNEAAGMGIREDGSVITGNTSKFVPHYFV